MMMVLALVLVPGAVLAQGPDFAGLDSADKN
jgi:hypothetical protein